MKITEIISEMQVGRVYSGGPSTIDRTSPWIKQAMDQAGKLTQAINKIEDPGEKYKYITGLKSPSSKTQVMANVGDKQRLMTVKSYDPATGEIVMATSGSSLTSYKANVSDLEYIGRERSVSSNKKYYKFLVKDLQPAETKPSTNKLVLKKQAEEEARLAQIKAAHDRVKLTRDLYWDDNDDYNTHD
jgi:hypothetical protein